MEENKILELCGSMPPLFDYDGDSLMYDEKPIANCLPVVKAVKSYVQNKDVETCVTISAIIDDKIETSEATIPLRQLNTLDLQTDLDPRCYEYPDKRSRYLIQNLLRYQASQRTATEVYQAHTLGFLHYNDRVAYNAGSRLIGDLGVEVELKTKGYHFLPPSNVSNEQLAAHIRNIIQLEPSVTAPIFTYSVLGILRDLFRTAGVPIHFCMFLVGEQQSMKTTLATYLCSLYDRHVDVERHLHNLTATEIKLHEVLNIEKDMVSIIDDLNLDDSKRKEREQESKISGLIRAAANGVGRETMRDQKSINAQPLFCGEYLLKNTSTNNRLLIVHLEQGQINKEKLLAIQNDVELLTAFADQFIRWLLDNYKTLCDFIHNQYHSILEVRAGGVFHQERLNRSATILSIAYGVFLKFCKAKGWDIGLSASDFSDIMANLLVRQIEDLNLEGKDEPDYVIELYELFRFEQDHGVVREGRPKKSLWKSPIYYDDDSGRVYILNEKMLGMCQEIRKKYGGNNLLHDLLDALDREKILYKDNCKSGTRSKKQSGRRCYILDYARWMQYMEEVAKDWEEEYSTDLETEKWLVQRQ